MNAPSKNRHPGGRPRKFPEPSRPITVTLPERTLRQLEAVDTDRAKAIAKVTDSAVPQNAPPRKLVDIVPIGQGTSIIVTSSSRLLRKVPFLRMVELAPSRFLLAVPSGTAPALLEVAVMDIIESNPDAEEREKKLLKELHVHLSGFRRRNLVSKGEILFVAAKQ